jgi:hypothetical protein
VKRLCDERSTPRRCSSQTVFAPTDDRAAGLRVEIVGRQWSDVGERTPHTSESFLSVM